MLQTFERLTDLERRTLLGFLLALAPGQSIAQINLPGALGQALKGAGQGGSAASLSQGEIGSGLKDLLKVAARTVVGQVGKTDGYFADPAIKIPLPSVLQKVQKPLAAVGASGMLDDLSLRMNRGAEQAAPKGLNIFVNAATNMSIDDARQILSGPQDSATQYFKRTCSDQLTTAFSPIVSSALDGAGALRAMKTVEQKVAAIPAVGLLSQMGGSGAQSLANFDLVGFATSGALAGLFHYLAVQEANIRANPTARTTDLLRKIFS